MSMWFKNLLIFHLPADYALSAAELEERLAQRPLTPCGVYDMESVGWVAPVSGEAALVREVNGQQLIALGVDEKLLPASVIRQVAQERAVEVQQSQGYAVGRQQMRDLKDAVADELRARALTKRNAIRAWIDPQAKRFIVDGAAPSKAETLLTVLRDTLDTFNAPALETQQSAQKSMTTWLKAGDAPRRLRIDEDLELRSGSNEKKALRYINHPLDGPEIQDHLKAGLLPTRLGLTWHDRIAFILTDDLQIKRVQFVGLGRDDEDDAPADERFDVDFALMTGELGKLINDVIDALGGAAGE